VAKKKLILVKRFRQKKKGATLMGGYGSGGSNSSGKTEKEWCFDLSASWMLQHNWFELDSGSSRVEGTIWSNCLGQVLCSISVRIERPQEDSIRLCIADPRQIIYLSSESQRFGGARWWLYCPQCGSRRAKLYLRPPNGSGFFCRACLNLTYRSCNDGRSDRAFMAMLGARVGMSGAETKAQLKRELGVSKEKWRRKRDRRLGYKERGWWLRQIKKDLKNNLEIARIVDDVMKPLI
jgi:hypothetical protein